MYLNRFPAAYCPTTRYYKPNSEALATRFNVDANELKLLPVVCQGKIIDYNMVSWGQATLAYFKFYLMFIIKPQTFELFLIALFLAFFFIFVFLIVNSRQLCSL